jgi:hypothetical protein
MHFKLKVRLLREAALLMLRNIELTEGIDSRCDRSQLVH